ncbi:nitroreductase family protein [Mobilitalea sibirica]|uniref:Nitroreductase family protein n=1 Tax=Mobilitalea sibirica TaxID=1462919 RepID=A0A8J7GYU7_9FIRM|nr:nitroreductase family protein [Mobilitalea sibirica]MBH1940824.1 nitroreductase family protein [Mobilitalea sibirica]
MTFLDLAKKRYSVRKYMDKEIEKEKIMDILEAGRYAPSAVNFQPLHFIVITDSEIKKKIYETYPRPWFQTAPVIIIACGDHSKSWKRKDNKDHCDIDVAIAIDHMTLAATDLGLGTCWICAFDAKLCHELLDLPEHLEVVALLPLGYPEEEEHNKEKVRQSLEDIVSWEVYQS